MLDNIERTLVVLKPDTIQRGLIGEIISKFEHKGFKIIEMEMFWLTQKQAEEHYINHKGQDHFNKITSYLASGRIVAMIIEGHEVINSIRKMIGSAYPEKAEAGTIRFDYATKAPANIIHASDSKESAEREMRLYFPFVFED